MARRTATRGVKQSDARRLAVLDGGKSPAAEGIGELRTLLAVAGAPDEVMRALDGGGDVEEALRRLLGALPSPEDLLAELLEGFTPLVEPGADPFSAELGGAEFVSMLREIASQPDELAQMLTVLIGQAQRTATLEALAMLRVLGVLGPPEVQPAATEAADRLTAAGLRDPRWVGELDTLEVGACVGFADECGAQEGIAVISRYGRTDHAVAVLIDHALGGGVKDCYPSDRPDKIRADYRKAARRHGFRYQEYSPAMARTILDRALAAPPCPVAPDQVEDVGAYLDLLRRRVALLPTPAPGTSGTTAGPAAATAACRVHTVKITLRGARPPIWRRLEVASRITLEELHRSIQQAFGWADCHLWAFSTPRGDYGPAGSGLGHRKAASTTLETVAERIGDRLLYTYDFGDDWEHEILVEEVGSAQPGVAYPRCRAGRRAAPPEDCGGIWGYQDLCEILADPTHPDHRDRLEWLGLESARDFRPAIFDPAVVNRALSSQARVLAG